VQYQSQAPSIDSEKPEQAEPRWRKELAKFISVLRRAGSGWELARERAGIETTSKNRFALRLMLGHTNAVAFRPLEGTFLPPIRHTQHQDLVLRGCQYAHFLRQYTDNLSFSSSVVSFQRLIFVSYCVVMLHCGVSKEKTDEIMRRYIVSKNGEETLARYRRGAVWLNRCMAALLNNGWGHRSWEIFLLGTYNRLTTTFPVDLGVSRDEVDGTVVPLRRQRRTELRRGRSAARPN
jgi:hypothetical protein